LVHFENRIYGIVVSAKSNYICGYIKEVVSNQHKVSAIIIGDVIRNESKDFNLEPYMNKKATIFEVTKDGLLFCESRDKAVK
jgi:hypothetical protein